MRRLNVQELVDAILRALGRETAGSVNVGPASVGVDNLGAEEFQPACNPGVRRPETLSCGERNFWAYRWRRGVGARTWPVWLDAARETRAGAILPGSMALPPAGENAEMRTRPKERTPARLIQWPSCTP